MPAPNSVKRSKGHLAITLALIAVGVVVGPYILSSVGLMAQLKPHAWIVLLVAYFGIMFKSAISYLMTHDFRYDKNAYDLCILVFGGVLTCTALQIVTPTDLFSGIQDISFLAFTTVFGPELRTQHLILLFVLLLASLGGTVLAAMGVADTELDKPCWWWTLMCSVLAYALLAFYALALIAKE
jgi:hypothetical protein